MKKLEILVTHYNEGFEVLKPLLDSINIQQSINFNDIGVIITNDGDDKVIDKANLSEDFYKFDIAYYIKNHEGVSAARNYSLDKSNAEYVMFCDCDDMFSNVCALWVIFREMNKEFDCLVSTFIQETLNKETNEITYINRGDKNIDGLDSVFIHGKVYRRQYLIDNKIRFKNELTIHEDSYFNCLATTLTTNTRYISQPFYLWKWRAGSICRSDDKYILKTYTNLIDSSDATVEQFILRNKLDNAKFNVCYMIFNAYYTFNLPDWLLKENKEYVDKTVPRVKQYYLKYKYLLEGLDSNLMKQAINKARANIVARGLIIESFTFNEWLAKILK